MPEKQTKQPRICYALLPSEMADPSKTHVTPIVITEGESGYNLTKWLWDKEHAEQACDAKNLALGIGPAEAYRMVLASMFPKGKYNHTPGPWIHQGQGTLLDPVTHSQITTERIETSLGYIEVFDQTNEPNANLDLIVAAPDLLAALGNLVADWERCHGPIPADHEAHAAIAKAKGKYGKAS